MNTYGVVGVLAAGTIALSMAVLPAHAGVACDKSAGLMCGRVQNVKGSVSAIDVYGNWSGGTTPAGAATSLAPGAQTSAKMGIKDADGFCIPAGRVANVSTYGSDGNYISHRVGAVGCTKVTDGNTAQVKIIN